MSSLRLLWQPWPLQCCRSLISVFNTHSLSGSDLIRGTSDKLSKWIGTVSWIETFLKEIIYVELVKLCPLNPPPPQKKRIQNYLVPADSLAKMFRPLQSSYGVIGTCSRGMINISTSSITNGHFMRLETPVGKANRISRVYVCLKVRRNSLNLTFDENFPRFVLKSPWNSGPNKFLRARPLCRSSKSYLNLGCSASSLYFNLNPTNYSSDLKATFSNYWNN